MTLTREDDSLESLLEAPLPRCPRGIRGLRATTWKRIVGSSGLSHSQFIRRQLSFSSGTPVPSRPLECPSLGPWSLWWRQALGEVWLMINLCVIFENLVFDRFPLVLCWNIPIFRRIFANAHTYHINSISVNSDQVHISRRIVSSFYYIFFSPGNLSLCWWPAHQLVAHGDHRSVLQHRRHQACQYGGTHRGEICLTHSSKPWRGWC